MPYRIKVRAIKLITCNLLDSYFMFRLKFKHKLYGPKLELSDVFLLRLRSADIVIIGLCGITRHFNQIHLKHEICKELLSKFLLFNIFENEEFVIF